MRVAAHVSVSDHRRTLLVDYLYQFKSKTQLHNLVSMRSLPIALNVDIRRACRLELRGWGKIYCKDSRAVIGQM